MSAETLRRAAALMREQHGPEHERHAMWFAMADWMDHAALVVDDLSDMPLFVRSMERQPVVSHAFAVARAYLGEV